MHERWVPGGWFLHAVNQSLAGAGPISHGHRVQIPNGLHSATANRARSFARNGDRLSVLSNNSAQGDALNPFRQFDKATQNDRCPKAAFEGEVVFMTPTTSTVNGLFAQLVPLLAHRAVLMTVSKLNEGGLLQVNICPRQLKQGENQALTAPLCITGTAIELDEELVPQIATFVSSHAGLNSNLIQIQKEIEEAEKAAREEAKKKRTSGSSGKKATEAGSTATPVSSEKSDPEPVAQTLSLFDEAPPAEPAAAQDAAPVQTTK
jgi:PRTRC genetic system protein E